MNEMIGVNTEFDVDVDVRINPKQILRKTAETCGLCPPNQKSMIATIVAKGVSLFLGILFLVLRGKAKAEGRKCKSGVFLALSILFFAGAVTSQVQLPDDEDEDDLFDDDFDADFEVEPQTNLE